MKFSNIMLAVAMSVTTVGVAQAADSQGSGKIQFKGMVVDAPCSIAPESVDQVIQMGAVSNSKLKNGGHTKPQDIIIQLEDCDFSDASTKSKVSATFSGAMATGNETNDLLNTGLEGSGIAIEQNGKKIVFGQKTTPVQLVGDKAQLKYQAYVAGVSSDKDAVVATGDFTATTTFELAYE